MAVTVSGNPIEDDNSPKRGMVLDFTDLKKIVNENIIDKFDHALVMKEGALLAEDIGRVYGNVVTVDFQPTSEMLVIHFADIVKSLLPEGIQLHSIKLWETEKSCAEWYAEDNR